MPTRATKPRAPVTAVQYSPPSGYGLDVELYRGPELRRRARDIGQRLERVDFHVLLFLTRGGYEHTVDFERLACRAGAVVIIRPGQVHRFGDMRRFDGWLLLFRSELLPPSLEHAVGPDVALALQLELLPARMQLGRPEQAALTEAIERMADDAKRPASRSLNALLNSQLHTVLLRLGTLQPSASPDVRVERASLDRFRRYRAAVEREHHRWHDVRRYAKQLGCSEKSLTRATREVADTSAKQLLTDRIVLEARRLLAHSLTPVASISDQLGFSEPTNFVKFFRRETGTTPGAFRRKHRHA